MPRATFSHSAHVNNDAPRVWWLFQDATTWAGIGPIDGVSEVVHDDQGLLTGFAWTTRVGPTQYRGDTKVVQNVADRGVAFELSSSELGGALVAVLRPNDVGCAIEITLEVTPRGTMATLFWPAISQAIERGLPGQVEEFAVSLSGG